MIPIIFSAIRWVISVGAKFFRVAPWNTVCVIGLTLVSQISQLLAFFLPLKVIILLGSTGIPRYFPRSFMDVDRDILVVSLSLATVFFYILFTFAEKGVEYAAEKGGAKLLSRSKKMPLFENQEEIASSGYRKFSRSAAAVCFICAVFLVLALIYLKMFLLLSSYVVLAFVGLAILYNKSPYFSNLLSNEPMKPISFIANIGFMLAFVFLVVEFLYYDPPGLLLAVVAMLLARQMFSRASSLVGDMRSLYLKKMRINALFFHGAVLLKERSRSELNFWDQLSPEASQYWVETTLSEILGSPVRGVTLTWMNTGIKHVVAFKVEFGGSADDTVLVKLFNNKVGAQARHEASLLSNGLNNLPSPRLIGVDNVADFRCHVFSWPPASQITKQKRTVYQAELLGLLLRIQPPPGLLSMYIRSRPLLWQRLDEELLNRLEIVAYWLSENDALQVRLLRGQCSKLCRRLKALPLCILNLDVDVDNLFVTDHGDLLATHWGRWSLEPVGAGWPIDSTSLNELGLVLENAGEQREVLRNISSEDAFLSAFSFHFEKLCYKQNYQAAIELIPEILHYLEKGEEKGINLEEVVS